MEAACAVINRLTLDEEAVERLRDVPNPTLQRLYQVLEAQAATGEEQEDMEEAAAPAFEDPTLPQVP